MSRAKVRTGVYLGAYCLAIWLAFDVAYSSFVYRPPVDYSAALTRSAIYDHGFAANFAGVHRWGRLTYPFYTNSLGFKDGSARAVPLVSDTRRVLMIGDSFTEGLGLKFEDSFVGMLFLAGQTAGRKTEFLNAGVSSYSPVAFYRKIKHLIDSGLKFDEVVAAVDANDVTREATSYFCIDEDPRYKALCGRNFEAEQAVPVVTRDSLEARIKRRLMVTDTTRRLIKTTVQDWISPLRANDALLRVLETSQTTGWPMRGSALDAKLQPLGVEGGVERALRNMRALAELLSARGIPLTVSVHPWPMQLADDDRDSRVVGMWRPFCATHCKALIDTFPAFFAYKDAHPDWYERLFIVGDVHFSVEGNRIMFREFAKQLL